MRVERRLGLDKRYSWALLRILVFILKAMGSHWGVLGE